MNFNKREDIVYTGADPEKNRENKKRILIIETLKTGCEPKANLVLVLLGEKPAMNLTVFADTPEEILEEEKKIKNIGLQFQKIGQQEKNGRYVAEFSVAGDEKTLNELIGTDPSVDHEKFGLLMGYPPSAIKSFLSKGLMDLDKERELLSKYPEIALHNFRLSNENNKEEIETLKRWNSKIEEAAPDVYQALKGH